MNCEMAEKNLSAYLDDMLDPQLHQEVAAHLESCAICSEVVAEYRRFDALLAETPRVSPPPELRDRIFSSPELAAAVRQQTESGDSAATPAPVPRVGRSPARGSHPRWTRIALQSAAVFAIIVGSALLFKQGFFHSSPTTTGHTPTPVIGNLTPTGVPLATGSRVIYEHDGALWSAPESGLGIGQQLTPTNIQVGASWSASPNGGLVAYAEAGTGRIHIIRSDGQSDIASSSFVALCTTTGALCADHTPTLAWSPDGRYIAYQSIDDTLRVVAADGTNDRVVTSSKQGIATSLLWSSDSNQLAFVEVVGTGESIFSFDFSSSRLIQVATSIDPANSAAIVQTMFWLPNKGHSTLTWTAWDATGQSLTGIFSRDLGSATAVRLTPTNLQLTAAGFTPTQGNGIWLVAATNLNGTPEIATVAAGQSGLDVTNAEPGTVFTGIYWSPAGGAAALVSSNGQMFLATNNGASLNDTLTSNVTGTPVWSQDGTHLATPLSLGIISLNIDKGSVTNLYRLLPAVQTPATVTMLWSPDSQDIAIATPSGTYLTSSDGKLIKQIDVQTATGLFVWSYAG